MISTGRALRIREHEQKNSREVKNSTTNLKKGDEH
jgi:hypothetical protein